MLFMCSLDELEDSLRYIKQDLQILSDQFLDDENLVQKACEYINIILHQIEMIREEADYDAEYGDGMYKENHPSIQQRSQKEMKQFLRKLQKSLRTLPVLRE